MKTQVSSLAVLRMIKNTIESQRNARVVKTGGVYLEKNKAEIYIVFGGIKSVQVFHKGFLKECFMTARHDEMKAAESEAHRIINKIYKLLDEAAEQNN